MRKKAILFAALALAVLITAAAATPASAQQGTKPQASSPQASPQPQPQPAPASAPSATSPADQAAPQEQPATEPPSATSPTTAEPPASANPTPAEPPAPSAPAAPKPGAAPGSPGGGATGGGEVAAPDKSFIQNAAHANLEEVELGRLAAEKAADPDVKAFGQKMADDYGKAHDQLKQVATAVHVVLPSGLTMKARSEKSRLEKLSGPEFDRAYILVMVKDHEKDIQDFAREAKRDMAPASLKNLAAAQLSTLKDHLKMAEDLRTKLGATAAAAARP
jgi:predicted outer membrane protein